MPNSTNARIVRGNPPPQKIRRANYRRALPELMRDFEGRCAYSLQHYTRAGGMRCMEVDHFDYRQKKDLFQRYENLFPATRHCNGAKSNKPTSKEIAEGLNFINPCQDWDYGKYIFEDPISHRLVGTTPQAIYHIRFCDLNAEHFVTERRDRAEILKMLKTHRVTLRPSGTFSAAADSIRLLMEQVGRMIPEIPPLSQQNR